MEDAATQQLQKVIKNITPKHLRHFWGNPADKTFDPENDLFQRDAEKRMHPKGLWSYEIPNLWDNLVPAYCLYVGVTETPEVWKKIHSLMKQTPEWWDFMNTALEFRIRVAQKAGIL